MTHTSFILASYVVTALSLGGAAVALAIDYRRQKAALRRLEQAGFAHDHGETR